MTISPAHSGTMGQESGEIWTAETLLQPILPKSDRLLDEEFFMSASWLLHADVLSCVHERPVDFIHISPRRMQHEAITHIQLVGRLSAIVGFGRIGDES